MDALTNLQERGSANETYRVNVSQVYGVPVLAVPVLGMSYLAVIQWIVLPPFILYLARRQMLGYPERKFK